MQDLLASPIPMLVMVFAIMYFLLIRPQQQRAKALRQMIDSVKRGDTVVTAGGIIGRVAKVKEDGEVLVDIADDVQVRVLKATISEVRAKSDGKADSKDKE